MIDPYTYEQCRKNKEILQLKIINLEHAVKQSEAMIADAKMNNAALIFLRRKISDSIQDLEILYLLKQEQKEI